MVLTLHVESLDACVRDLIKMWFDVAGDALGYDSIYAKCFVDTVGMFIGKYSTLTNDMDYT